MANDKPKLELTWIGKDIRPKLEPRVLIEDAGKSYHAARRVSGNDLFDNRLIFGDNLRDLEGRRNTRRRELFDAQDAIDRQREELIRKLETQLQHASTVQPLFTIRWRLR